MNGRSGLDLLDIIQKQMEDLSSERREMPSPDHLEDSTSARVLCSAGDTQADTLRRADGLTIRRLSWSLQMSHVENLAQDLPPTTWKSERVEFYNFARNHVLRPENIFDHYFYLNRLLGFAVSLNEWDEAKKIVNRAFEALNSLTQTFKEGKEADINGISCKVGETLWRYMNSSFSKVFIDSIARHLDPKIFLNESDESPEKIETYLKKLRAPMDLAILDWKPYLEHGLYEVEDFFSKARLLAVSDLSKYPYKKLIAEFPRINNNNTGLNIEVFNSFKETELLDLENLKDFIKERKKAKLDRSGDLEQKLGKIRAIPILLI